MAEWLWGIFLGDVGSHRQQSDAEQMRNRPTFRQLFSSLNNTKFDLKQAIDLPFTTEWFSVPPAAPHGHTPELGTLHPSLVRSVQAAFQVATE
jgi:hypothetical protein